MAGSLSNSLQERASSRLKSSNLAIKHPHISRSMTEISWMTLTFQKHQWSLRSSSRWGIQRFKRIKKDNKPWCQIYHNNLISIDLRPKSPHRTKSIRLVSGTRRRRARRGGTQLYGRQQISHIDRKVTWILAKSKRTPVSSFLQHKITK